MTKQTSSIKERAAAGAGVQETEALRGTGDEMRGEKAVRKAFSRGKAFIPFITCGDPDIATTKDIVRAMAGAGADLIELGIPFSDPTAEGPTIQEANLRALTAGTTTDKIFDMVADLRGRSAGTAREEGAAGGEGETLRRLPLVFMTYANVVFSYGTERFLDRCVKAGVDGIILPDVPFEEKADFAPACRARGLSFISLVAPTSRERIEAIAGEAEGFLYVVSSLGVTGERSEITTDIAALVATAKRANKDLPCAVGFGISTPEQAAVMAEAADGVIVGSAIVKRIAEYGQGVTSVVADYVSQMKKAITG